MATPAQWQTLYQRCDFDQPPHDMNTLYVEQSVEAAAEAVDRIAIEASGATKVLLAGCRGGGKSTELRRIAALIGNAHTLTTLDLAASGLNPAQLGAGDLLYVLSAALLGGVPENARGKRWEDLKAAYAGEQADQLGDLDEALARIVTFGGASVAASAAAGLISGPASVVAGTVAVVKSALRLFSKPDDVLPADSPEGSKLAAAADEIATAAQAASKRPLLVLIDGLERLNGESVERFKNLFERTRLLLDRPFRAVLAAPPCTVTEVQSAEQVGWKIAMVYGFGDTGADAVESILTKRLEDAGLGGKGHFDAKALRFLAERSGGLPRAAIWQLRETAFVAWQRQAAHVDLALAELGAGRVASSLARGLDVSHYKLLDDVDRTGQMPAEAEADKLFAGMRIFAEPPTDLGGAPTFRVHPLLARALADSRSGRSRP